MQTAAGNIFLVTFLCQAWRATPDFPSTKYSCKWDPRKVLHKWGTIDILSREECVTTAITREDETSKNFMTDVLPTFIELKVFEVQRNTTNWVQCSIRIWTVELKVITSSDAKAIYIKIFIISPVAQVSCQIWNKIIQQRTDILFDSEWCLRKETYF